MFNSPRKDAVQQSVTVWGGGLWFLMGTTDPGTAVGGFYYAVGCLVGSGACRVTTRKPSVRVSLSSVAG